MRRQFYNNPDDVKRIQPYAGSPDLEKWETYHQIEKNAWLWNETNLFIEKFKDSVDASRHFYFDFNKLNVKNVNELLKFLNVPVSRSVVDNLISKPRNVQKKGNVAGYGNWKSDHKSMLNNICGDLAGKYEYEL
jgi:hypothetical protein